MDWYEDPYVIDQCKESLDRTKGFLESYKERQAKEAFVNNDKDKEAFVKSDSGKTQYHLVPPNTLKEVADVFTYGARKYSADNWHKCDDNMRYFDAAMRHLMEWRTGAHVDESGFNHLGHAIASLIMLRGLELDVNKDNEWDQRLK